MGLEINRYINGRDVINDAMDGHIKQGCIMSGNVQKLICCIHTYLY